MTLVFKWLWLWLEMVLLHICQKKKYWNLKHAGIKLDNFEFHFLVFWPVVVIFVVFVVAIRGIKNQIIITVHAAGNFRWKIRIKQAFSLL